MPPDTNSPQDPIPSQPGLIQRSNSDYDDISSGSQSPSAEDSPTQHTNTHIHRRSSSLDSGLSASSSNGKPQNPQIVSLVRPKLGSRKSSGTIIVSRDSPQIEVQEENYDENDARTMSPRKSSEEIERMGHDARNALMEQAKALQQSLQEICDRVESVKHEHEKLEGGNRFLQSYIGELMQTSKITSKGTGKGKGKARA